KTNCASLSGNDAKAILQTGLEHGVLSLIHYSTTKTESPNTCPDALLKKTRQHNLQGVAAELLRHHELEHIIELLNTAGLKFLLMKGGALAHTLYPQPHLRERCDTDLLFPDKPSSDKAWEILKNEGYKRNNTLDGDFVGYQFSCSRELSKGLYSALDIHRKLNDIGFFANLFEFEELKEQSIPVPQLGPAARGLNHTYALLLACIHRIINIPLGIDENRLIWIYDMHLLCNSFADADWREFCTLARQKQLAGVCLDGLEKSERFFDTTIPVEHHHNLVESARKERLSPHKVKSRRALYYLDFVSNKGFVNKSRQLREHLFPSVQYMMNKYNPKFR
ncbi:MAG: nucleotidyltransferase family protein, partial [Desulfobacterales bacterium]|nr:nucleotidyltransferase family protein [Desulfobacterales bacterium]